MNKKEELSLSGSANTQSPPVEINSHSHGVVRRRSFLKSLGMAGATLLPASALLMTKGKAQADERQERNGKLTKGDVAILRLLAAAEIIDRKDLSGRWRKTGC